MFSRRFIRTKALQYLYTFFIQRESGSPYWNADKALLNLELGFVQDVENLREAHAQLLQLLLFWASLDASQEKGAFPPKRRHLDNHPLCQPLRKDDTFVALTKKYPLFWPKDLLQLWYYDDIQYHDVLLSYKKEVTVDVGKERDFMRRFLKHVLLSHKGLQTYFRERYINWETYKAVFSFLFLDFIKRFYEGEVTPFAFHTVMSFTRENNFYRKLVQTVVCKDDVCEKAIAVQVEHWDTNRIVFLDKILLKLGISEAFVFPEIPHSVTINEYIEMAKEYSTPKSYQFINGLLDVILKKNPLAPS